MKPVDYSEEAIDLRIRRLAQLRDLCLSLARAGAAAREKRRAAENEKRPG
jgi:hypothetical protein